MALLDVIPDSDPLLRKTSKRVKFVDDNFRKLVSDMYETMVANYGVGLAAIQVGVPKRFFIYEIPKRRTAGYESCETDDKPESDIAEPDEVQEEDDEDYGYTGDYIVCLNPRIIEKEGSFIEEEGCLSRVGWVAKVERAYKITFEAYDLDMKKFTLTVTGLASRCVQHEIDHLDGILFTDRAVEGTLREITEEDIEPVESEDAGEKEIESGSGSFVNYG